ncbi:ABC-three component system protein [Flammeovirga aprica]|uniref:ABC-three component systems C-terminal domain-containing protein n=1 Tax=Flammeovirga aprica JL-4 TaxID=694437 RepID=A0A7X9P1D9_9BACT|nr:ABC-three component system protein [Flammeovirga aprica]NME66582.1 hypothetical protein [Flammeovirga aprica JL-4]
MPTDVRNINAAELHSAMATWSGFVYQGKVAIYHVIRLLTEDVNATSYDLQLDSLDDFAILSNNTILSLHQVKSEKSNLYSNYREAFDKLEERIADFPAENAFFHLAVENRETVDTLQERHPNLEIYQYSNNNYYCGLDEIDELIESAIINYHTNIGREELSFHNNIKAIRYALEEMILKQVISIHAENHRGNRTIREGAFHLTIQFDSFTEKLNSDMAEWLVSELYFIHLFKSEMNSFYQEYLLDLAEDNIILDDTTKIRLSKYLIHISSLNQDDIQTFIRSIFPHRTFRLNSIADYGRVAPKEEEMKDAFFFILKEITQGACIDGFKVFWKCNDDNIFVPSAIESSNKKRVSKQIIKNIIDTDLEAGFEKQNIITANMGIENIVKESNLIKCIDINSERNHLTSWVTTSLVTLEDAKNRLNHD